MNIVQYKICIVQYKTYIVQYKIRIEQYKTSIEQAQKTPHWKKSPETETKINIPP